MRVLGVVTARGGSKGIPNKNIRLLGGRPLLAWTADAALAAKRLSRVILSTDDAEIAELGKRHGLEVPFTRPAELAEDASPTLPVLVHAVTELERTADRFDAVCLLQPTAPLRTAETIDGCIALLEQSNASSVITVLPVPHIYNPHWVYFERGGSLQLATGESAPIPRRQGLPPAYHREGSVYVTRRDVLVEENSLYGARVVGYHVDPARTVNIDTIEDWARAESLIGAAGR